MLSAFRNLEDGKLDIQPSLYPNNKGSKMPSRQHDAKLIARKLSPNALNLIKGVSVLSPVCSPPFAGAAAPAWSPDSCTAADDYIVFNITLHPET